MNEFDQYMKHRIKAEYYIRYADDFVIVSTNKDWLCSVQSRIEDFLCLRLNLSLHPNKVSIQRFARGVDFLGWVHCPNHRILRRVTKRRMLKNIKISASTAKVQSYLGLLSHGNTYKLRQKNFC